MNRKTPQEPVNNSGDPIRNDSVFSVSVPALGEVAGAPPAKATASIWAGREVSAARETNWRGRRLAHLSRTHSVERESSPNRVDHSALFFDLP